MRLSSRLILPAGGFLAAVLAALLVATGAFAGEQPKTEKILISDHIGDATIVMISGVDTGRAVVTFKQEIDDIVEDCARNDYKNEDGDISSDGVVKCTREGLKASGGEARIRRANCLRATLSMEFGNFSLIDYVKEEHGLVRTNWKNHKQDERELLRLRHTRTPGHLPRPLSVSVQSGIRRFAPLLEPFPFRLNRNGGLVSCFDAFSSREPVSAPGSNPRACFTRKRSRAECGAA